MSHEKKYETTFVPECFKAESSAYEGTVTLKIPDWEQRANLLESIGVVGGLSKEEIRDRLAGEGAMKTVKVLARSIPTFFVSAAIERKADKARLTLWEDVTHEGDLALNLVPELAWRLVGRHNVEGPSTPS